MKNLKKVLALVLAFACAFTMFAGAAFSDQADINSVHAEAVDTLVALGVIKGYEDGSFKPDATITRAEMAKMIYVLRTGNDNADAYAGITTSFTDVNGTWGAGYIKYCQAMGIIAGKSATKFDPDNTVTGEEAAKMLLVTLGYNADTAGLVGAGWAQKTLALADENGILDDVLSALSLALPREDAAQMMFNAIDAPTVRLRDGQYTNLNDDGNEYPTIGERYMGLSKTVGILDTFVKTDGKETYEADVTNVDTNKSSTGFLTSFTKIEKDYSKLKNQKVKVLYKESDKVYGIYSLTDTNTVLSGVLGDFEKDSTKLKFDGTKYNVGTTVGTDNVVKEDQVDVSGAEILNYVDTTNTGLAKSYDTTAISNTDNSRVNLLSVEKYAIAQVTYVGSDYINVTYKLSSGGSFASKLEKDDCTYPSDIKKDDYVAVTSGENTGDGNVGATKLEVVEGKITSTKKTITADDYQIQIGGDWYESAFNSTSNASDLKLGATVAVVVKDGYVIFVDNAKAGATDVALVIETFKEGNTHKATLMFADGKTETVSLKRNAEWDANGDDTYAATEVPSIDGYSAAGVPQLVAYSKSGSDYKLQTIGTGAKAGYDDYQTATGNSIDKKRMQVGAVAQINSDAVVYNRYKSGTEYKFTVTTGSSMQTWNSNKIFNSYVLADKSNSVPYAKIVFADMTSGQPGGGDAQYGYVFNSSATTENDTDYIVYDVWNGEESVNVKVEGTTASASQGDIVEYTENEDGSYDITVYTLTTQGVVLNSTFDGSDVEGNFTFAAVASGDYIAKTAAEVASAQTVLDISYDDDESMVFFVNTNKDDSSGNAQATSGKGDNDFTLIEEVNGGADSYRTNAKYYQSGDKVLLVIDTEGKLNI